MCIRDSCNADAGRANELMKKAEIDAGWHFAIAWSAAIMANDEARAVELSRGKSLMPEPASTVAPRVQLAAFLHYHGREQEAAAILDEVAPSVPGIESMVPSYRYAALTLAGYYSMRGDQAATRRWVEDFRERLYAETKNDRYLITGHRFDLAEAWATAGMDDEAIAELRRMFEEPGGRSFRMVDAYPAFDRLKGTPEYEALRAEFGEAR